jgi:hypothetical protein
MLKIFAIDFGCYGSTVVAGESREEAFALLKQEQQHDPFAFGDQVESIDQLKELELKKGVIHSNFGDR